MEYKQQTRLEEKRKKALDQHLNFIVGQTEKYSTWLTEGLNKTDGPQSIPASINSSRISSPVPQGKCHSDGMLVHNIKNNFINLYKDASLIRCINCNINVIYNMMLIISIYQILT